jgi:hypothetical protein
MFDSGKPVKELIDELKDEVDIALEIHEGTYLVWLNTVEQLCYSEIIKEQKEVTVLYPANPVNLAEIEVSSDEAPIRFEDIITIYADNIELMKSTVASGQIFPNTYYKSGNNIGFNADYEVREFKVIYNVRPKPKTTAEGNIMFPLEFVELVKAKLRGEAYKLVNEDALALKWLNDYNVHIETFKAWCNDKGSSFGL